LLNQLETVVIGAFEFLPFNNGAVIAEVGAFCNESHL